MRIFNFSFPDERRQYVLWHMSPILTIAKNIVFIGAGLSFIPLIVALYFFPDEVNEGKLLIRLSFTMGGLIIVYLVFKIIKKLIDREEKEKDINTRHLVDLTLFTGVTNTQILIGLGAIVGILLVSLVPAPWNIFLMLGGFYGMFGMMTRLA